MGLQEEIRDFLIESMESLANLDREIVQLEQNPADTRLIASAFRAVHTIKGTSGFFGFETLGALTHVTENVLSQVRDGKRALTPELVSLILSALDEVKALLAAIEATGQEGEDRSAELRVRLEQAASASEIAPVSTTVQVSAEAPPGRKSGFQSLRSKRPPAAATGPEDGGALLTTLPDASPRPFATAAGPETGDAAVTASKGRQEVRVEGAAQLADSTIRVDVGLLNRLMNLVGELVLARNQLLQDASAHSTSLQQTSQRLNLITSELQEGVMKTRMQPIGVVWHKLPRVVRDLAAQCGKKVRIEMDGAETELDKTIIEAIKDPLTHIVRNCCDHGIETPEQRLSLGKRAEGVIQLRAYHEGGVVNIEISDDGAGIDPERLKRKAIEKGILSPEQAAHMSARDALHIIFLPGFSTAAQITSISGRGVGMDVVKSNLEQIGGTVEVMSRTEGGTTIRIKIPLTLAIIPGLVVTLNKDEVGSRAEAAMPADGRRWRPEERFIIPQANLLELVHIPAAEQSRRIENVHGTPVFHHRGKLLPLLYLGRVLGRREQEEPAAGAVNLVVLQVETRKIGLAVDRIWDTQEIVVKPLGRQLKGLSCYVGATIMGDGRPALILDVVGLARLGGLLAQGRPASQGEPAAPAQTARSQKLLLFRAGSFPRVAVPLVLVDRLEEVDAEAIERAAGRTVLHYRGEILPLISLAEMLVPEADPEQVRRGVLQIIVFSDGPRRMGLIVDQIVDIVDEAITVRHRVSAPGILGSAVISGKITDLLDLHALLRATGKDWAGAGPDKPSNPGRVLVVEGRTATREMLQGLLETDGHATAPAETLAEALGKLRSETFDLVITALDLSGEQSAGLQLLQAIRGDVLLGDVPVLALLHPQRGSARNVKPAGLGAFDAHVYQDDRTELLNAVASLVSKRTTAQEVRQ